MNDIVPASESPKLTSLEAIEQARQRLAEARTFDDVVQIQDVAEAVHAYQKRAAKGTEAHAEAWALCQEAKRKLGELTRELPKGTPGRKRTIAPTQETITEAPPTKAEVLRSMGVGAGSVARAEKLAEVPSEEWTKRVEQGKQRIAGGKAAKDPGATTASTDYHSDEWCTPAKFIEAARAVFGGVIELDPASNALAQNTVRAERWNHRTDSGLIIPWQAKSCWLNPPYSRTLINAFAEKCCTEFAAGHFEQGIVLTNSSTETGWYQALLGSCSAVCLPDERIAFELQGRAVDDNRNAQTFFYLGDKVQTFHREFSQFGSILAPLRGFL